MHFCITQNSIWTCSANTGDLWVIMEWNYDEQVNFEYKVYILEITLMLMNQELHYKKDRKMPKNIYDGINKKVLLFEQYLFPEWKETRPPYSDRQFEIAKECIQGWKKLYSKM